MKILITSDNHLGYKGTDPVRGEDSFNTFEEILQIARLSSADLILQGGDFFDENKPSRNTYNKTIQLLRKYCSGVRKSEIKSSIPINNEDESMSIDLPVLCIHGNHDDPSGFNVISPLDILHSAGLVTYFGRQASAEHITIEPVLLEKGPYRLAIYGLGYMKGRLVHRAFKRGDVSYRRPEGDGWHNILVVHQDRVPRADEHLSEDFIDPFIDLVVYGHEHESIKFRHKNFDVIQCGSTIRTSLCDFETHDKYTYILDLSAAVPIKRIRLQTVRPFLTETMRISRDDPEVLIKSKLEEMAAKAGFNHGMPVSDAICADLAVIGGQKNLYAKYSAFIEACCASISKLPLLRLRVEVLSDATLNKHNLQQCLYGITANPSDVLRIIRKPVKKALNRGESSRSTNICNIYSSILKDLDLSVLQSSRVLDALDDYVFKDTKNSFSSLLCESINSVVEHFDHDNTVLEDVTRMIKSVRSEMHKNIQGGTSKMEPFSDAALGMGDVAALLSESDGNLLQLPTRTGTSGIFISGNDTMENPSNTKQATVCQDFTFLEEKQAAIESRAMVECFENDPRIKKSKNNDSDSDILAFMNDMDN